jgi:hypothetical protein
MKYREMIADRLSKQGCSWGYNAIVDSASRIFFGVEAQRADGRYIVRSDELLTAFIELENAARDDTDRKGASHFPQGQGLGHSNPLALSPAWFDKPLSKIYRFLLILLLLFGVGNALGQTRLPAPLPTPTGPVTAAVTSAGVTEKSADGNLLEFQKSLTEQAKSYQDFLKTETDRHQTFLQTWFERVTWVLGIAGTLFLALIGLTHWKALAEVKKDVKSRFGELVRTSLDEKTREFEAHLDANKTKVDWQVEALQKRISQTKIDVDRELDTIVEFASIAAHAAVVLSRKRSDDPRENLFEDTRRRDVLIRLKKFQRRLPAHRTLAIFIGRLLVALDDLPGAIEHLDKVISFRQQQKLDTDADYGALLYNKACYLNLLARSSAVPRDEENLRNRAWKVLQACMQLVPGDKEEAQLDPDLADIVQPPDREWENL